jgi:ABC-type protease/lipase transport system fused ATPase/permease subunit
MAQLQAQRPLLRQAFFFGLVASLLVLAPTAYMFEVYGRVVNSRNGTTLLMLTLFVLCALAVMEAMKMEHTISAPRDGVVAEWLHAAGDQVAEGAELLKMEAAA